MIKIIAAISKNSQIGLDNQMPWHIPEDLNYFKNVTTGKVVLMGRKTFESIGTPLPNRKNVVLTHNLNFKAPGVKVVHTLEEALSLCNLLDEVFIIGGSQIYTAFLPYTDELYLTLIDEIIYGDTSFPSFQDSFKCIRSTPGNTTTMTGHPFTFTVWTRK